MKAQESTFKKILKYLKPYSFKIILSVFFALITSMLTLLIPIFIGKAVDSIIGVNQVDFKKLITYLLYIGVFVVTIALFQWCLSSLNNHIVNKVSNKLRNDCFNKINNLTMAYLDKQENGNIVSIIINDVEVFKDGLLLGFTQLFTGIITIVGTLAIMVYYNFYIALMVFLLTPISFFVARFISKRIYSMFKKQAEIIGKQTSFIEEIIQNQKVVHSFSMQKEMEEKFDKINKELLECSMKASFYSSLTNPLTRFVNALVYASVAILGAILILNGSFSLTPGLLTTFLSYANQYTKPFNEISGVVTEMQNAFACAQRVFNLLDEKELADESQLLDVLLKGDVTIKDVYFSYSKDKPLIENFNVKVKQGQKVAIVGKTGCGKTTLINLLMKFYPIDAGNIYYDDYNLKDIKAKSLRNNIGMVLQETWLKSGTIKENICFGRKDASDEEIKNVLEKSHCDSFINLLPNKIDTIINEDGGILSLGQKQLLCIARLMLCKPPILILDEATSNIDTRTEIKIQEAFNELMKGKTSFIVAHRLSTIINADIIIVMDKGHIVEIGNHHTLLEKNGFYANLFNSQFDNKEERI